MECCCEVSRAWHVCEDAHSYSLVINSNPSEWVALCWGVGSVLLPRWHSTGSHMESHKYNSSLAPHASNDDWHVLEDAAEFKWLLITARWQPFIVLQHIMMWFEYVPPQFICWILFTQGSGTEVGANMGLCLESPVLVNGSMLLALVSLFWKWFGLLASSLPFCLPLWADSPPWS